MPRAVLGLGFTGSGLLIAAFVTGFASGSGSESRDRQFHVITGLGATFAVVLIHSIVYNHLATTGRWLVEMSHTRGMPAWLEAVAARQSRRMRPHQAWGIGLVLATAVLGAAAGIGAVGEVGHLGVAAVALGFNVGVIALEAISVRAHARLLGDVKDRAGRLCLPSQGRE